MAHHSKDKFPIWHEDQQNSSMSWCSSGTALAWKWLKRQHKPEWPLVKPPLHPGRQILASQKPLLWCGYWLCKQTDKEMLGLRQTNPLLVNKELIHKLRSICRARLTKFRQLLLKLLIDLILYRQPIFTLIITKHCECVLCIFIIWQIKSPILFFVIITTVLNCCSARMSPSLLLGTCRCSICISFKGTKQWFSMECDIYRIVIVQDCVRQFFKLWQAMGWWRCGCYYGLWWINTSPLLWGLHWVNRQVFCNWLCSNTAQPCSVIGLDMRCSLTLHMPPDGLFAWIDLAATAGTVHSGHANGEQALLWVGNEWEVKWTGLKIQYVQNVKL